MLRQEGFQVGAAADALAGLRAACRHHPDAILLEAALPDMDDCEVCRLRPKIGPEPASPRYLYTACGTGRHFEPPDPVPFI